MTIFQKKDCSLVFCAFFLLAFHMAAPAHAQLTTGDQLPAALKDIKASGGVCRRDDSDGSPNRSAADFVAQADFGCAIAVNDVRTKMADPRVALIDLRPAVEYQVFHIENSLSIDLAVLQSKPYWRDKTLVLIGGGKLDQEIYTSCARLKQVGYKQVYVLNGGMLAWLAQNQAVIGRPISAQQQARLNDAEFWKEVQGGTAFLVLSKEHSAFQAEFPLSVVLPQVSAEALRTVVERRRKTMRSPKPMSVVLMTNSGISDEQIRNLQQAVIPETLLVYTEGLDAYKRQVATQKAIWAAQAHGPKQPRCGS